MKNSYYIKEHFRSKLFLIVVLLWFPLLSQTQNKVALVIGNSNYAESPLRNPVNDATDIESTLTHLGFQVTLGTDLNQMEMENAIRTFGNLINTNDIALFYFSGHGTQVKGLNYLIPVGQNIYAANEIKYKCVEAGFVLDKMESGGSQVNIVILDACRDNPFKSFRSGSRGFAHMSAPTGTIISYSTAPGSVARDGTGRNSPYTKYLLETIILSNLQVEDVFKKVREKVILETNEAQTPWESSSLIGDFYFVQGSVNQESQNEISLISNEKAEIKYPTSGSTNNANTKVDRPSFYEITRRGNAVFVDCNEPKVEKFIHRYMQDWGYWNITLQQDNADFILKFVVKKIAFGSRKTHVQFIDSKSNTILKTTEDVSTSWSMTFKSNKKVIEKIFRKRIKPLYE